MFELGKMQDLVIREINHSGALLVEKDQPESAVLLPGKQIPDGALPGTVLRVFLYKDSEGRLIATTLEPALTLGQIASLTVVSVTDIGAFLSWGLDRDLFLPFHEQNGTLHQGQKVLVTLYIDKSERLAASMHIYDRLSTESPYRTGDRVEGVVYQLSSTMGALVAVDDRYFGLIPRQELYRRLKIGERVQARVIKVRPDGKLNLSIRKKAYAQMSEDADRILQAIEAFGGELPFNDKEDPEVIQRELELSKAAFKRAVGQLLKKNMIEITDTSIRWTTAAEEAAKKAAEAESGKDISRAGSEVKASKAKYASKSPKAGSDRKGSKREAAKRETKTGYAKRESKPEYTKRGPKAEYTRRASRVGVAEDGSKSEYRGRRPEKREEAEGRAWSRDRRPARREAAGRTDSRNERKRMPGRNERHRS